MRTIRNNNGELEHIIATISKTDIYDIFSDNLDLEKNPKVKEKLNSLSKSDIELVARKLEETFLTDLAEHTREIVEDLMLKNISEYNLD